MANNTGIRVKGGFVNRAPVGAACALLFAALSLSVGCDSHGDSHDPNGCPNKRCAGATPVCWEWVSWDSTEYECAPVPKDCEKDPTCDCVAAVTETDAGYLDPQCEPSCEEYPGGFYVACELP